MAASNLSPAEKFARQKRLVVALGVLLIIAGAVILFVLRRVPLPLRIMAGLGDVFIGCVLLVMVNQVKSPTLPGNPPPQEKDGGTGTPG